MLPQPHTKRPDLSIIVPAHNEENNLGALVAELETVLPFDTWEVLLIDDGSRDGTATVIRALAAQNQHVHGLVFSRNFGKEAAMIAGLDHARGRAVAIMDADLQHPPELLPQMIAKMQETGADQVIAQRNRKGDGWAKTFAARTYYRIVNSAVEHVELTDGSGDFRLLSERAVAALRAMRERTRFSKGLFSWIGFQTEVIHYDNRARNDGVSSWSMRQLWNYGLDGITSFNTRPLRLIAHLGIFTIVCSLIYLVALLIGWAIDGVTAPGYITLIAAVFGFGGVQLFSIALVGEYVGKIYLEVKARPLYIVATEYPEPGQGSDNDN